MDIKHCNKVVFLFHICLICNLCKTLLELAKSNIIGTSQVVIGACMPSLPLFSIGRQAERSSALVV